MTEIDKAVLIAFAKNGMNKSYTGNALFMHRNTVDYHLKRVRQKTGKNPNDFFELAALLGLAEVRHGHWIESKYITQDCSVCGFVFDDDMSYEMYRDCYKKPKFCPNCGAKMDGKGDGE